MVAFGSKAEIRIVTNSVSEVRIVAEAIGSVRVMIIHENFYFKSVTALLHLQPAQHPGEAAG